MAGYGTDHGLTEWLADNKKKYRQVFDRFETSYIYAELSFYNKRFDEEDWEVDLELISKSRLRLSNRRGPSWMTACYCRGLAKTIPI
jgi:CRISPR/Cas system-associated protein Cas10 (large subunit of type III CRISPR-Cas system)